MTDLVIIGLSNVAMASVLAVIAFAVGRWSRNAALAHALWLLFFVKLITPPLIRVPLPWPGSPQVMRTDMREPQAAVEPMVIATPPAPAPLDAPPRAATPAAIQPVFGDMEHRAPAESTFALSEAPRPTIEPPSPVEVVPEKRVIQSREAAAFPWFESALLLWLGGAGLLFWWTAHRVRLFQSFLRHAVRADAEVQACADEVARKLGVRLPSIWLVPGIVSPMLWSFGTSRRLLLPVELLRRLSTDQQRTLLAHELAHLRRGDHWVRYLEIIVLCAYWWCPLVWWARRELHAAEEECCDAWVVWALPHLSRDYALALVETLDFLCEVKPAPPTLASGIRPVPLLRRRLTMIMRGSSPRVLTAVGSAILLVLAALALPMLPGLAQDDKTKEPPPRREIGDKGEKDKEFPPDVRRLQQQLEELHRQRAELDRRLHELHQRLKEAGPPDKDRPDAPRPRDGRPDDDRKPEPRPKPFPPDRRPDTPFPPGHGPVERRLDELERKVDRLMEIIERIGQRPFPPRNDGPPPFGKDKERETKRPAPPERPSDDRPRPERPDLDRPLDPRPDRPADKKGPAERP